jgi:Family of unknown function (DUF5681)
MDTRKGIHGMNNDGNDNSTPRKYPQGTNPALIPHMFKKGQSGNPNGKPPHIITRERLRDKVNQYFNSSLDVIEKRFNDPNTPAIDLAIIAILKRAIEGGEEQRFEALLNRSVGKVMEEVAVYANQIVQERLQAIPLDRLSDVVESLQKEPLPKAEGAS